MYSVLEYSVLLLFKSTYTCTRLFKKNRSPVLAGPVFGQGYYFLLIIRNYFGEVAVTLFCPLSGRTS